MVRYWMYGLTGCIVNFWLVALQTICPVSTVVPRRNVWKIIELATRSARKRAGCEVELIVPKFATTHD